MRKTILSLGLAVSTSLFAHDPGHDYITVSIDDTTTSDRFPLGDYSKFFESADRPALASFDFSTDDKTCVIIDSLGRRFNVIGGQDYQFSKLYFPFKVIDEDDNNNCDNSNYSNIRLEVNALSDYSVKLEKVIDQNRPFGMTYLQKIKGLAVNMNFSVEFYHNFEAMECLGLKVTDRDGQQFDLTHHDGQVQNAQIILPLVFSYNSSCLTSKLVAEEQENKTQDLKINFRLTLAQ